MYIYVKQLQFTLLQEMNDLFCTKPWIQPVAVAGSNINDELEESSSHQATRGENKGIYTFNSYIHKSYILCLNKINFEQNF